MSFIPLKDWIYLGLIVALISLGLYERQHLINEGEAKCLAREKDAAAAQAAADLKIAQDTTDALNLEISRLRSSVAPPSPAAPAVRVQCYAHPVPAAASLPGTARPGEPAAPGALVQSVPGGAGSGPDLGPSLQRLAIAADLLAARDRACLKELKEP